jgi:hypothetical protein
MPWTSDAPNKKVATIRSNVGKMECFIIAEPLSPHTSNGWGVQLKQASAVR